MLPLISIITTLHRRWWEKPACELVPSPFYPRLARFMQMLMLKDTFPSYFIVLRSLQVLNRLTYASTLSHLRRLNSPIGREGKFNKVKACFWENFVSNMGEYSTFSKILDMWTETFTNGSSCREACKTSSATQFSLGNDVPSRDPGRPGVKHFPSLFFWMIRVIIPVVVAAILNRMNLSSLMAGMWACEESGSNGLHYCWISCQSHLGVFGGVEYREFWGNVTSILSEAHFKKNLC